MYLAVSQPWWEGFPPVHPTGVNRRNVGTRSLNGADYPQRPSDILVAWYERAGWMELEPFGLPLPCLLLPEFPTLRLPWRNPLRILKCFLQERYHLFVH